MRLTPTFAALVSAVLAYSTQASTLDATLAQALNGTNTPAIAALEIRDGKVVAQAAHGLRRSDRRGAVQISDVWATGSDAKPMTAAMIARLVDRGVLSWDTPLSAMLPELAADMQPAYRNVTLVQLLSHRAGLPHDASDMDFIASFFHDARPLPAQRLAYLRRALAESPETVPGQQFSYSNTGFVVAAAVAERATGTSYETLMQREVFTPLGMKSARFAPTHDGEPLGHRNGKPIAAIETADDGNPLMLAPAGAELHLNLADWAKFCIDQLAGARGQGKLLTEKSYHLMQTPQGGDGNGGGLGWGIQDSVAKHKGPVLVHAGSDGNWYALVALFPGSNSGALIAANAGKDMGADTAARNVFRAIVPELSPAQ
ncbi:MAG: beta-lactamase family protein [Burkholderiales bacterium]|nr:beta-lactamase family protein [Burkholderiales bacterium]